MRRSLTRFKVTRDIVSDIKISDAGTSRSGDSSDLQHSVSLTGFSGSKPSTSLDSEDRRDTVEPTATGSHNQELSSLHTLAAVATSLKDETGAKVGENGTQVRNPGGYARNFLTLKN